MRPDEPKIAKSTSEVYCTRPGETFRTDFSTPVARFSVYLLEGGPATPRGSRLASIFRAVKTTPAPPMGDIVSPTPSKTRGG